MQKNIVSKDGIGEQVKKKKNKKKKFYSPLLFFFLAEFDDKQLTFSVSQKPCFHIPLDEVAAANSAAKNEISIEFSNTEKKKREDQLVEIRFYVPGQATKEIDGDDEGRFQLALVMQGAAGYLPASAAPAARETLSNLQGVVGPKTDALLAKAIAALPG